MSAAATDYTFEFVTRSLPSGAARLLEVGCGAGALAARLAASGLEVVAIDSDAEAVAAARSAGADAREALWPGFSDGRFDAVLFTRSLHHVEDLDASVRAAADCLNRGGRIIVEDFDFGFADEATLTWCAGLVKVLGAAGLKFEKSSLAAALLSNRAAIEVWHGQHDHELHPAQAIEAALRTVFPKVAVEDSAYFFRYVADAVDEGTARALLRHERELMELGMISALGRRFVAEP